MDSTEYMKKLSQDFNSAYMVAEKARQKGYDPKDYVEIRPAPDLASRVEGLINIVGIAELIRRLHKDQPRSRLAFDVVNEICTNSKFDSYDTIKRIELAVKVGSAILTEGVLVAPTEGIQEVKKFRNPDGTEYIAVVYAGPIRGAGGTAAALSAALADYARRIFRIDAYKPTQEEIERYVEEMEIYHSRIARLQYKPSDADLRVIVGNLPVCIDGVPKESVDVGAHANLKRIAADGKELIMNNKVRSGVQLVLCEGIAQKAKKVLKEVKAVGLDWDWLNKVIKVDVKRSSDEESATSFLDELVAGRPILAYPGYNGGFRLRYGRSRMTGIAAKGLNPATMIITMGFVAVGTQLKMNMAGKGAVMVPVDSIEGPFVKLKSGECIRVNDAETAQRLKQDVVEIISLGDILITYGDFRKTNTQLQPTSYVEELWGQQLAEKGVEVKNNRVSFKDAYELSLKHKVPMHPAYTFEFASVSMEQLLGLVKACEESMRGKSGSLFEFKELRLKHSNELKRILELLNAPHKTDNGDIVLENAYAQSLLASLGFASGNDAQIKTNIAAEKADNALSFVNSVAPFRVMNRSTFIGARVGRPEKAKERLMKPAPNVLFPIGSYGSKERNISTAYLIDAKKMRPGLEVEIARYRCRSCKRLIDTQFCYDCQQRAYVEKKCISCNALNEGEKCRVCGNDTVAYESRVVDLSKIVSNSLKKLKISKMPNSVKGVMGLTSRSKTFEPLEKGILRSMHNVHIFKDGTARFDMTDMPMTHFYPSEIKMSVEKLKELGYDKDYMGNELTSPDQLVEMRHQDVILNAKGAEFMLNVAKFIDDELADLYGIEKFYNMSTIYDLVGQLAITLSPHTSCGVLNRIIGFTDANVGFAHPYTISARRRNCDGDEDTIMLLLDALLNFSRDYLPSSVGGTMDAPLILTLNVMPEEIDDEVHVMEVVDAYPLEFYNKTMEGKMPGEASMELVENRLGSDAVFSNLKFTHMSSQYSVVSAPKRSLYTQLKTMQEKVDAEFKLMDMIDAVDRRDAAKKLILSHFIPDLIGNLHSFSKQIFRCTSCNAKYRRVPLSGKCTRDGGRLLLTISKGGIEKYLDMAITLAERYDLDLYIKQRLKLIKHEIDNMFGTIEMNVENNRGQFNLTKFM